ncbi:MAG: SPOR domain-containing protein, partial [Luteimonas sp.]
MAAKRGKSQARRNTGGKAGLPGWAWLVLGVVLTVVVVLAVPRFFRGEGGDGFFRPKPNPDAQPATTVADDAIVPDDDADAAEARPAADKPKYDFYTLLPADEVAMSDAEVAAIARDEAARKAREGAAAAQAPAAGTGGAPTASPPLPAAPR